MFIKTNKGLGLILFNRAASSSITNSLHCGWSEVSGEVFAQLPTRVAFMRHPLRRLFSSWALFAHSAPVGFRTTTFAEFLEDVCADPNDNPHVLPQVTVGSHNGKFLADRVICWNFGELGRLLGHSINFDNRTPFSYLVPHGSYDMGLFARTYAGDLLLWNDYSAK